MHELLRLSRAIDSVENEHFSDGRRTKRDTSNYLNNVIQVC